MQPNRRKVKINPKTHIFSKYTLDKKTVKFLSVAFQKKKLIEHILVLAKKLSTAIFTVSMVEVENERKR